MRKLCYACHGLLTGKTASIHPCEDALRCPVCNEALYGIFLCDCEITMNDMIEALFRLRKQIIELETWRKS